jgi:hypothetical protein
MGSAIQYVSALTPLILMTASLALASKVLFRGVKWFIAYRQLKRSIEDLPKAVQSHTDVTPGRIKSDVNGLYSELFIGEKEYRIRLETSVSELLLHTNRSLPEKEMAIQTSRFNSLSQLPSGVVSLTVEDKVVGMGSRVLIGDKSYLVTASHLMPRLVGEQTYICSTTKRWKIVDCDFWSNGKLDVLLINIPSGVWAELGVKALGFGEAIHGATTQVHGYAHGELAFSVGTILKSSDLFQLKHTASTLHGWSGTPLIINNKVVAIHTGSDPAPHPGSSDRNECTGIYQLFSILKSANHESPMGQFGGKEIPVEEMTGNDYEFEKYEFPDLGEVYSSKSNYAVDFYEEPQFKMKRWSEMALQEDDMQDYPVYRNKYQESGFESIVTETASQSLNFQTSPQQVVEFLKPCTKLADIISPEVTQPAQQVCPSMSAEPAKLPTEVLAPVASPKLSKKPRKSSRNSMNGDGPRWVQRQNLQASSSNLQGTKPSKNQKVSGRQLTSSLSYIPPQKRPAPVESGPKKA